MRLIGVRDRVRAVGRHEEDGIASERRADQPLELASTHRARPVFDLTTGVASVYVDAGVGSLRAEHRIFESEGQH